MTAPDRPTRERLEDALVDADRGIGDERDALDLATEVRALRAELGRAGRGEDEMCAVQPWVLRGDVGPAAARTPQPAEPRRTSVCTCSGTEDPPLPSEMDPACPLHGLAPQPAEPCERCAHCVVPGCPDCLPSPTARADVAGLPAPLPAVPDGEDAERPHLVDASAPAMRKLLRRISARQMGADDAVDVLLAWPNRADTDKGDRLAAMIRGYDIEVGADGQTRHDLDRLQRAAVDVLEAVTGLPGLEDAPNDRLVAELRNMIRTRPDGEDVPSRLDAAAEALALYPAWEDAADWFRMAAEELREDAPADVRAAVAAALARPTPGPGEPLPVGEET